MPKVSFPARNQIWEPNYLGDYWGDFTHSFGLNLFSSLGRISPSLPLVPNTTNQDPLYSGLPTGFARFDGKMWAVADRIYRKDFSSHQFVPDTYTNSPLDVGDADIVTFKDGNDNPILVVSRIRNLAKLKKGSTSWDADWWTITLGQPELNNTVHPLAVLGKHLFIGDGNLLHSVDQGGRVYSRRLIFPSDATIQWIKTTPELVFLGVLYSDSKFSVVEYDPLHEKAREFVSDEGACVGFILDDNLHILTQRGNLKYFNGNGFTYYATFPNKIDLIYYLPHRNGIAISPEGPIFLVNYQDFPYSWAGIYLYEKKTGRIYHRYPIVFNYNDLLSFGICRVKFTGALFYSPDGIDFYAGVSFRKTNLVDQTGIYSFYFPPSRPREARGFIILPKLKSNEIDNLWQNVFCKYYLSPGSKIIIKYQKETADYENKYPKGLIRGTWQTPNSFVASIPSGAGWQKGDEVNILEGDGAGLLSHITDINFSTGVITIEDSIIGASGNFSFFVDNYRKLGEITDVNSMNQKLPFPEIVNSNWIRLKIELRGAAEIEDVSIQYKVNTQIE